jgi:LysM repeat protein
MKILKIFGIVVGIHVFALILIFANPGCSSTTKPPPVPTDTVAKSEPPPVSVSTAPSSNYVSGVSNPSPLTPAPINFNPDAPATAATTAGASSGSGVRFTPTRPGTPVAGTLVAEPVADVQPATTYVVKAGDSLWSIAKKNHLATAELAAANGISANAVLKPGQKLKIPGAPSSPTAAAMAKGPAPMAGKSGDSGTTAAPAAKARPADGGAVKHVVKSGETLGGIAKMYEVKASDIAVANSISDPAKIKAGMELIIPGWQTPASKSGKSGRKSVEPKTAPTIEAPPQPTAPPQIPVIRLEDSPVTPAPKP